MQVHIPDQLHKRLKLHAVKSDKSMGEILVKYIEDGLKKDEKKETENK